MDNTATLALGLGALAGLAGRAVNSTGHGPTLGVHNPSVDTAGYIKKRVELAAST